MAARATVPVRCTSCDWSGNREPATCGENPCPKCKTGDIRVRMPKIPSTPRPKLARVSTLCSWMRVACIGARMRLA